MSLALTKFKKDYKVSKQNQYNRRRAIEMRESISNKNFPEILKSFDLASPDALFSKLMLKTIFHQSPDFKTIFRDF